MRLLPTGHRYHSGRILCGQNNSSIIRTAKHVGSAVGPDSQTNKGVALPVPRFSLQPQIDAISVSVRILQCWGQCLVTVQIITSRSVGTESSNGFRIELRVPKEVLQEICQGQGPLVAPLRGDLQGSGSPFTCRPTWVRRRPKGTIQGREGS